MEWSREERTLEKPLGSGAAEVELVEERCVLSNGKARPKVNRALSAPPLPDEGLSDTKAYVMIVPGTPPKSSASTAKSKGVPRHTSERIVGCVVASRITKAMRVLEPNELESSNVQKSDLVCVDIDDSKGNVYCDPTPLPATLGIPRLFVVPSHRRQGIANKLLDSAAKTAIWGCPLKPAGGQIAFSQPTASGRAVMKSWGGNDVRIYNEH
ncbi:GNAT family acetyltransferase [Ceratobasidium sp. AG-Ba]|nr:GNAT family acetyltransferase [Ceratobasidium sp. AG-Ba]